MTESWYPGKKSTPANVSGSATPDTAKVLQKFGFDVLIESRAGIANFSDDAYRRFDARSFQMP